MHNRLMTCPEAKEACLQMVGADTSAVHEKGMESLIDPSKLVRMSGNNLPAYVSAYRTALAAVGPGNFAEPVMVRIFVRGLSPSLKLQVNRNPQTGNPWATVEAAI